MILHLLSLLAIAWLRMAHSTSVNFAPSEPNKCETFEQSVCEDVYPELTHVGCSDIKVSLASNTYGEEFFIRLGSKINSKKIINVDARYTSNVENVAKLISYSRSDLDALKIDLSYSTITNKHLSKFSDALAKKRPKSLEINLWKSSVQPGFFDILLRGIAPTQIETLSISFYSRDAFNMGGEDFTRFKAFNTSPLKNLQLKFFEYDRELESYIDQNFMNSAYEGRPIDLVHLKNSLPVSLLQNLKSLSLGIYSLQPSGLSDILSQATALDSVSLTLYHNDAGTAPIVSELNLALTKLGLMTSLTSLKLTLIADYDASILTTFGSSLAALSSTLKKLNFTTEQLGSRFGSVNFVSDYIASLDNLVSLSLNWQNYFGRISSANNDAKAEADSLATSLSGAFGSQLTVFEFALNADLGMTDLEAGTFTNLIGQLGNLVKAEKILLNFVAGSIDRPALSTLWDQLKLINGGKLKELLIDVRRNSFAAGAFGATDSLANFQDTLEVFSLQLGSLVNRSPTFTFGIISTINTLLAPLELMKNLRSLRLALSCNGCDQTQFQTNLATKYIQKKPQLVNLEIHLYSMTNEFFDSFVTCSDIEFARTLTSFTLYIYNAEPVEKIQHARDGLVPIIQNLHRVQTLRLYFGSVDPDNESPNSLWDPTIIGQMRNVETIYQNMGAPYFTTSRLLKIENTLPYLKKLRIVELYIGTDQIAPGYGSGFRCSCYMFALKCELYET